MQWIIASAQCDACGTVFRTLVHVVALRQDHGLECPECGRLDGYLITVGVDVGTAAEVAVDVAVDDYLGRLAARQKES